MRLCGLVMTPDGADAAEAYGAAPLADAAKLGAALGTDLRASAPARALGL